MAAKTDDSLWFWLPPACSGALLGDLLGVLNAHGYESHVEMAPCGRGHKMRVTAQKRKLAGIDDDGR